MKEIKNQKQVRFNAIIISLIAALVVGLIALFVDYSISNIDSKPLKILFSIGVGFTTTCFVIAISFIVISAIFKYSFGYLIATIVLLVGTLILFILCGMEPWIIVILMAGLSLIAFLSFFLIYRYKLVLVADNEKPDYKDYKTRLAEKEENKPTEEQPLPEIKSFKD